MNNLISPLVINFCNKVEKLKLHEIEEKIIMSFINNKPSSLLIYE